MSEREVPGEEIHEGMGTISHKVRWTMAKTLALLSESGAIQRLEHKGNMI